MTEFILVTTIFHRVLLSFPSNRPYGDVEVSNLAVTFLINLLSDIFFPFGKYYHVFNKLLNPIDFRGLNTAVNCNRTYQFDETISDISSFRWKTCANKSVSIY